MAGGTIDLGLVRGPNQVTGDTDTTLTGLLAGSGGKVTVLPMSDLDGKANQTQIAEVETGPTASRAYSVGEYFCMNGVLYRVTVEIATGGTITPGTNCAAETVKDAYPKQYWFNINPGQKLTISVGGSTYQGHADVLLFPRSNSPALTGGILHFWSFDMRAAQHGINVVFGSVPAALSIAHADGETTIENTNPTYSCTMNVVLLGDRFGRISFSVS